MVVSESEGGMPVVDVTSLTELLGAGQRLDQRHTIDATPRLSVQDRIAVRVDPV
jgi:hypothetical protein